MTDTQHYFKIAHWVHSVMFEPFIERYWMSDDRLKTLSKQMFNDAWWTNSDNNLEPMDVYSRYYNEHEIPVSVLVSNIRLAKFEVNWKIKRMKHNLDIVGIYDNPMFEIHYLDEYDDMVRYKG